jgi:large subunit ribosomal protein L25
MKIDTLTAQTREDSGKGPARRLRATGEVPCILYGGEKNPLQVRIDAGHLEQLLHAHSGSFAVVNLEVSDNPDENSPALMKAVQRHPLRENILTVEFQRIRMDQKIQVMVQVELTGRPKGVQEGGVLDQQLYEIEVECLALDIPEKITKDVSGMEIGDAMHVSDLEVPEGVAFLTDGEFSLASVHVPQIIEEPEEEELEGVEGAEGEEGEEGAEKEEADES